MTGELNAGGVKSGGTTSTEIEIATQNPKGYVAKFEAAQLRKEVGKATLVGAGVGAAMGLTISAIKNAKAVSDGAKDLSTALIDTGTDTVCSTAFSAAAAGGGRLIGYALAKLGLPLIARSNAATGVAAGLVDLGITGYQWANGDITGELATKKIIRTGTGTSSAITGDCRDSRRRAYWRAYRKFTRIPCRGCAFLVSLKQKPWRID